MKRFFIITLLLLLSLNLSSNELEWVDEQIEAIKPPREGISEAEIASLKDPFIFVKKADTKSNVIAAAPTVFTPETTDAPKIKVSPQKKNFILDAIINKSALINGKWYRISDKIDDYTVSKIDTTSITLSKKGKEEILSTSSKNLNLKFKNK
ncbi:MAG: hypothetical protein Q7S59_08755 [Sulfurimonas sp.]|nr:hypothetical protein [Sulfurimonas sp.]